MATCKDCLHWNACKKMLEAMWGHSLPLGYEGGANRCKDFISAADVAPRAEVAREIFEEIEDLMREWFDFFRQDNDIRESCAIMAALSQIAELKKKYTEGEK